MYKYISSVNTKAHNMLVKLTYLNGRNFIFETKKEIHWTLSYISVTIIYGVGDFGEAG